MKRTLIILLALVLILSLVGCSNTPAAEDIPSDDPAANEDLQETTIMIAAAASLETAYVDSLIPRFNELYPQIKVEGAYDSSGKLQIQIEEGLAADVFMSASTKQMNALVEGGFVNGEAVINLLRNEVVLIEPIALPTGITSFENVLSADIIAIGDPQSVPAGQYAVNILTNLGIIDEVLAKASLGTNVTQVLNWVGEGSADVGFVYATDAAKMTDKVTVIATAPEGSLDKPIIYPLAPTAACENIEAAEIFVLFLQSEEALTIFESYGFKPAL